MGMFNRIQNEIEAREKKEGISPADLLELSPLLRRLISHIARAGEVTAATAAQHLEESPAETGKVLDELVEKGYLEREKRQEEWVYRARFARKRGRDIPVGIWSALEQRTKEE